jgi:hypothetical protein
MFLNLLIRPIDSRLFVQLCDMLQPVGTKASGDRLSLRY